MGVVTYEQCPYCLQMYQSNDIDAVQHICMPKEISMTQSTKFPDAETVAFVAAEIQNSFVRASCLIDNALDSYRTRTGIDLADVSDKLASGKWRLMPIIDWAEMIRDEYLDKPAP